MSDNRFRSIALHVIIVGLCMSTVFSYPWEMNSEQADDINEVTGEETGRLIAMGNILGPIHDTPPTPCKCRKYFI